MENFFKEYVDMWKRWSDFDGKSNVKDFWMAWLVNFIIILVFTSLGFAADFFTYIYGLYSLALIIPGWAIMIRRFHDTNRSGWYWLWSLIPFVGWIIVLIALIKPSE